MQVTPEPSENAKRVQMVQIHLKKLKLEPYVGSMRQITLAKAHQNPKESFKIRIY